MSERWTEVRVFTLLEKVFPSGAWALLPQVRNGTGFSRRQVRTADALAISCWPSRGLYLAGIEIKVRFHDWRKELADTGKAEDIAKYCRYWYLAAPADVVPAGEIPETWGYIECTATSAKIVKAAEKLEERPVDMLLLASILRKLSEETVPKPLVDTVVEERVKAAEERAAARVDWELGQLQQQIARFEEASGVKIERYREKEIGEAVKSVLAGGHLQAERHLKQIKEQARGILEIADRQGGTGRET